MLGSSDIFSTFDLFISDEIDTNCPADPREFDKCEKKCKDDCR